MSSATPELLQSWDFENNCRVKAWWNYIYNCIIQHLKIKNGSFTLHGDQTMNKQAMQGKLSP